MLLRQLKCYFIFFQTASLLGWNKTGSTFHSQDTERHQWESASGWWSAHTRPYKDVALRAEKKIALLVLPDIEKRASFAIFVYTQYYYNNFFSSSFCTWHSRTDDESFSLYQIYIQSSVYLVIYLLLVNLISFFLFSLGAFPSLQVLLWL
jgi:hypothetical protein